MKRQDPDVIQCDSDDDATVGPLPPSTESKPVVKKRKILQFEETYLRNIPSGESYEKSFMHRDVVTHVLATQTDFIITASCDGHVKFWKKLHNQGVEFVKHFRAHLSQILHMCVNSNGTLLCTISDDKALKVFDVVNFDMINMIRLGYVPRTCAWIHCPSDPISALAVAEKDENKIHIYDARETGVALKTLDKVHSKPVVLIEFNRVFETVISVDEMGVVEYWTGPKFDFAFPANVEFKYKTDTDLYEFAKIKQTPSCLTVSPNGKYFATFSADRKLRFFRFLSGKISKVIDESLQNYIDEKDKHNLAGPEFHRRISVEKELQYASENFRLINLVYDESSNFILYSTLLGVKVVNLKTNKVVRLIGKPENFRILNISLCRAIPAPGSKISSSHGGAANTAEMEASDNPALQKAEPDPMLVCSAYKKNRFYLFTNSEPYDNESAEGNERDVFNEKPKKEDMITPVEEDSATKRISDVAIIHTTMGDIFCKLFPTECPKTVENFCTHARHGYFNGHTFHRVIKSFMIQTGDPTGTGMGGESIWGHDFEDEINASLKHDRPYTISMANAGPNTNGSQFFITVCPTPHLDGKHTVFGRVTKGMEVVQNISKVRTNPKNSKPFEDISIISLTLK